MSEQNPPVITVKQEVESCLRTGVAGYIEATNTITTVNPATRPFYDAVISVLNDIIDGYLAEGGADDPIKVGDTVRTKGHPFMADGTEFKVTAVEVQDFTPSNSNITRKFFVKGDPNGYGVWDIYIEKVHA
jgi:hypothetical protein